MASALEPAAPEWTAGMDADLIEALEEPTLVVRKGIVRISNAAARAILGDWIDGKDVRLAIRHPKAVERLLSANGAPSEEVELTSIGDLERRWLMKLSALPNGAKLVRLLDKSDAYAAEKMRVDFVANASHELRTPLANLLGYTEILIDQGEDIQPDVRMKFQGIIHDEAQRMQRLVEDLISLSRIEADRFKSPKEAIAIESLLSEVRQNWSRAAAEQKSKVLLQTEAALPMVAGDRQQLLQVFDNLVSNALRYGRHGGTVTVTAAAHDAMVEVEVRDEGEGIPAEHLPRLTERFYRVNASRSRASGGTGLGLAIVKHIVERHSGRLTIQSRIGEGTRVTVALPVAPEQSASERTGDGQTS